MTDDTWQHAVLEVLERLVGAEQTAQLAAQWSEHDARDRLEVTFLGPYSSGKSTLLRRLVVDGGAEVPDWLTVSARRETFELNAIDVGDLTFTDAPGFAAGNDLHDELAQDALALSDAFLLVVPPQMLTTNRELVGSILSGRYFFGEPLNGVDRATIGVIAQADSMGIDPDDDVDGMRQLAERKRSELIAQLEDSAGIPLPGLQVFCVAADPYEEHARNPQPRRSAFDPYRSWDGIEEVTAALAALPGRAAELRRSAGIRYFCRVGADIAAQASAVADELQASAEELRARRTEWTQQKARVDAIVDAAKADLQTALVVLPSELSDELGVDQAESRHQIDQRMAVTIDQWAQRWDGELDLVLGEAGMQVDERLDRPRAKRTDEFLRSIAFGPTPTETPQPNSRVVSLLNSIRGELNDIARQTFELRTGESLDRLLKGRRAGSAAETAASVAKAKNVSVVAHWPDSVCCQRFVVLTGGEPALQLDAGLLEALHARGCAVAIETNGTLDLPPGLDWICVSPKAEAPLRLTRGDELKLVFPQEGAEPGAFEYLDFTHFFLQPMDGPQLQHNTQLAAAYCLAQPRWRLSLQAHKLLGMR